MKTQTVKVNPGEVCKIDAGKCGLTVEGSAMVAVIKEDAMSYELNKKDQVVEALGDWLMHVTNKKELATPEEVAALPKVAEVFLNYHSSVFSLPVKKS